MIQSGNCIITIDGEEAGEVEYKFEISTGTGQLWIGPDILMDAFSSRDVTLRIDGVEQKIAITTATPGEAAQFSFLEWRRA